MQFILIDFKKRLPVALLRLFVFALLTATALGQIPALSAQAAGEPKLILTKSIEGGVTTAKVGDVIRYRIRLECSSLVDPCGKLEITDVLQSGLTYLPPPNSSVPTGFTITESPAGTITIRKLDVLLDGSQYDAVIAVKVNYDLRPLPALINNTINGRISPDGGTTWLDALPATAPPITIAGLNPSWGLTKTLFSPTIDPTVDTDVTYQIRLCPTGVSGNVPLENIVITDTLPTDAVFVSASDGGAYSSATGKVTWDITGPVTPPACATRYVTIRYPKADFSIGESITNSASTTFDYKDSSGGFCVTNCYVVNPVTKVHPIDDIFDVPSYGKSDVGDPVGMSGTARFVLNLNTNGTNYPANNVMLIDNMPPQFQVTEVTGGAWSEAFDYVREYVEYSTNNGVDWTAFGGVADYNDNAVYTAPVANITNVRWRFEYDSDGDGTYTPGLPYTWSFTSNPEIRVKPRTVAVVGPPDLPAAVNGATYNNCVQVSRIDGDPGTADPTIDACKYEGMTVRGDYVSLRTTKTETPGVSWDDLYDPLIQNPGFIADYSILPGDMLKYTLTVDMTERSSANLINPTIQDTLPADLIFVRFGNVKWNNGTLPAGASVVTTPATPTGTPGGTLKWVFSGLNEAAKPLGSNLLTVEFFARIPRGQAPGSRTNNMYVVTDSTDVLCEITGTQSTDTGNIDSDASSAEAACKTTDTYIVERSAALRGEKWIRSVAGQNNQVVRYDTFAPPAGTLADPACPNGGTQGLVNIPTNPFTRYPCISRAYPENSFMNWHFVPPPTDPTLDDFEYNLRIFNDGNVAMMKYVLYDILPYYGDKGSGGTLTESARESQFRPALRGPVQLILPAPGGLTAANFSIEYNLTTTPCRPEVFNTSGTVPSGCDNTWSPIWSAAARSYRIKLIEAPGVAIPPSTSSSELRFGVPMSIPADVDPLGSFNSDDPQSYEIAWNSFSHVGSYTDLNPPPNNIKDLLASEPRKVGITIPEVMSIGNRVWRDSDNSGTINPPDDTNPGIPNVVVNLYRDANNDGAADGTGIPSVPTIIATTTTDANGYYLFSNIFYDSDTANNNLYIVGIPASNFAAGNPLENLLSSTGTPAESKYTTLPLDTNADKEDSGIDTVPPPALPAEVFSPTISLQPNTESASETDLSNNTRDGILGASRGVNGEANSDSDLTVDFGFFGGNNIPFSIGNHVWFDDGSGGGTMNDGIRQGVDTLPAGTEPPVVGARVYLYRDGNNNGIPEASEQIKINSGADMLYDLTDSNGFYLFDNLDPGEYYVQIAPSNFAADPDGSGPQLAGPLAGWYSSQPTGTETTGVNGGITTADIDSDDNGVNEDNPESKGVFSGVIELIRNVPEPLGEAHLSGEPDPGPAIRGTLNPTGWDGDDPLTPLIIESRGRYGETDETSNLTIDFGFIPPMSLGNRLWIDDGAGVSTNYNNGIMDSGELGVNGALVELWRDTNGVAGLQLTAVGATPADRFIRNDTTNADGYYLFDYIQPTDGLIEPEDYFVHIPASNFVTGGALVNYVSSSVTDATDNADDIDDNGIDSVTPMSTGITSPLIEMGYGDEPLTSPTAGFTEIDIPADTLANRTDYGTDRRGLFGQADANSNLTVDFGFMAPMSIGNRVWLDSDNSGTINAADNTPPLAANPGIANVVINLYVDADDNGVPDDLNGGGFDPDTDYLLTDITDSGGYYLFSNLGAGKYIVGIPASNFDIVGDPLYALKSSTGTPTPPATPAYITPADNYLDQADHGIDPALVGGAVYSPTINLSVGAEPVSESDLSSDDLDGNVGERRGTNGELDSNSDLTVDFGFYTAATPYSIGNHLWKDDGTGGLPINVNDGIRQSTEPPVVGALVELYRDGNKDGFLLPDEKIRTDLTDSNGFYLFDNLEPGKYYVRVASSNFAAGGPLVGWYSSQTTALSESDVDNDDNGIDTNTPETYGVLSSVIILGGAAEPIGEIFLSGQIEPIDGTSGNFNPTGWDGDSEPLTPGIQGSRGRFGETDATSNLTIDFGFIPPMSLGNRVWIDSGAGVMANYNNGVMNIDPAHPTDPLYSEIGVNGARVELYRDNATSGTVGSYDAGDAFIGYKNTDPSGYYLFENLQSGSNYFVRIPASNFTGTAALVNYVSSTVTDAADNTDDIDDNGIDPISPNTPATSGITSPLIAMLYGTEPSATESDNTANIGTLGQTDLNSNLTMDFGFISPMSLGNRVWRDSDNSGTINAADNIGPGIANVVVNLYQDTDINGIPDGARIAFDTTDANGYYLFDNLPAGNYIVGIPAGNFAAGQPLYALKSSTGTPAIAKYTTAPVDETNLDKQDHGRDPIPPAQDVFSPIINLTIGAELTTETDLSNNAAEDGANFRGNNGEQNNNSDLTVDFGFYGAETPYSIGNRLWYDNGAGIGELNNGQWDSGELPVVGARVELYRDGDGDSKPDPEEYIRFDVTDAPVAGVGDGGYYLFDNLDPGTYFVLVSPGNFTASFDPDGPGTAYPVAVPGALRGWYSSQFPVPPPGGNAEVGTDSDDDGIDTDIPETNGVFSGPIILTRDTTSSSYPEPSGETLSGNIDPTLGFNPTAGDGAGSIGRFGEIDTSSNLTVDFGFIPPMSLGNRVWIDDGAGETTFRAGYDNGIMDFSEVGKGSVRVELWRDTNGLLGAPSGSLEVTGATRDTFLRYTTTDNSGYYLFERLQPGDNYYIHIRASNFAAGGPLVNYVSSAGQPTSPPEDDTDINDNGVDNSEPATYGITSQVIEMAYTSEPQLESDLSLDTAKYGADSRGLYGQADNNSNLTKDFGFVLPPRSIGNYLWFDTGMGAVATTINNGIRDIDLVIPANSEVGVVGARVSLYRDEDATLGVPDGAAIAFDTTDANGYYLFDNLPAGRYLVGVDGDNFDASGLTGLVGYTTSTGSVDNASSNLDSRDNGIDRADPTVAGSPYGILSTTIDLSAIPIPVDQLPTGETLSGNTTTTLGNNPTAGDGSASIGRYGETDANSDLTIDFGFVEAYALGNRVWFDTDNNGLMNLATEIGVSGVQVALYHADASGNPTTAVMAEGVARTAVTNADGYYLFDYLAPGEYVVVITADNFDAAGAVGINKLVGYWSSLTERNNTTGAIAETAAPDPDANGTDTLPNTGDDDVDLDDNGTRQTTGTFNNAVISKAVTIGLTGTSEPTGETDLNGGSQGNQLDGRANMKVDFGFYKTEIGNLVYEDLNQNGTYDDGAPALINGATVHLYRRDGTEVGVGRDGILGTADDNNNGVTTGPHATYHPSWLAGEYHFSGLPAGDYIVKVTAMPAAYPGMISTIDTYDQGDNDKPDWNIDNNDNGDGMAAVTVTSETASTATNDRLTMTPGGGTKPDGNAKGIIPDYASGTTTDNTVDFGFVKAYSLGNRVWFDNGAGDGTATDGLINGTEPGIGGVTVNLYLDSDNNGTPDDISAPNDIFATKITDANGYYRFDNLLAGTYIVEVAPSTPTNGLGSTTDANQDPDDDTDSNDDGVITLPTGQVRSKPITLGGGTAEPIAETDPIITPTTPNPDTATGEALDNRSNRTVDFGFVGAVALGNVVWFDTGAADGHYNNGIFDTADESGVDGITVNLYYDADKSDTIAGTEATTPYRTTVTTGGGFYQFDQLIPGRYQVGIPAIEFSADQLVGYTSSTGNGTSEDVDHLGATGDENGVDQTKSVLTDIVLPTGGIRSIDYVLTVGGEPTADLDREAGGSYVGTLLDNSINFTADFGFTQVVAIGNRVWFDTGTVLHPEYANNHIQNVGEAGVEDVTVELFSPGLDGVIGGVDDVLVATTSTNASGDYVFDGLKPGSYYVHIPAAEFQTGDLIGYSSSVGQGTSETIDQTDDENGSDNQPSVNGVSSPLYTLSLNGEPDGAFDDETGYPGVLDDNDVNYTADFGFTALVAIGNVVWKDTGTGVGEYNNGKFDTGEVGVNNVTVNLYYDADNSGTFTGAELSPYRTTQTAASVAAGGNGYYEFDKLTPGRYYVGIPNSEFLGTENLVGYTSSTGSGVDQSFDDNTDENGQDTYTISTDGIRTIDYVLTPGVMPTTDNETSYSGALDSYNVNFTADFGFVEAYSLGNRVWHDVNRDGKRDGGEPSLEKVTVNLYRDLNNDNVADGGIILTDVTDANGYYRFDNLPAGNYIVEVIPLVGYASTVDAGDADADLDDDDDNGVFFVGGNVRSHSVTLGDIPEPSAENNPADNPETDGESPDARSNRTVDFGFMSLASATVGEKHLTATDQTFTSGSQVAIGEILTYQATLQVPSGVTLDDLMAQDLLDPGLGFVDCDSIVVSDPAGLTTTLGADFSPACKPDANPTVAPQSVPDQYNDASQIVFSLGDVTNGTAATQTLTITYRVIVLDVPGNVDGISGLNNRITWAWGGSNRLDHESEPVEIIEPDLDIDKSASPRNANYGRPIHFTIDIAHTAQSRTDAFDVVVTDVIPAGLTLDPATIVVSGTASTPGNYTTNFNAATNTLTVEWEVFRLGETARVTFDAVFVGPSPVVNSANVAWTSLPIDPQPDGSPEPLSDYNDYAHERWYDPADAALIDNYLRADDVTIRLPVPDNGGDKTDPWALPTTGFAPNVITQLPPMPAGFAYAQTEIRLEIPKLKQTLTIVGVPYDNKKAEWNLTWLNTEAGWLENTAFPTHAGNSALTAHTTTPNGQPGPFAKLDTLSYGDQIIIHLDGQKYIFEVRGNKQVKPNAVKSTLTHEEYPWLTLLTCKSYNEKTGEYAYRTAVRAVLVKVVDE